jgi:ABC-2 type transport system ATP-binding protein
LILDEPTNGLDPNQIRQVRGFIRELAGKHTILLSTHILAEVEQTCDRVIILDEGVIKAIDTPSALSAGLRTATHLRLEIQCADAETACERLRAIDGVRTATLEADLPEGWLALDLRAESAVDVRLAIVETLRQAAWPMRELHRVPPKLEEVFLELTHRTRRS